MLEYVNMEEGSEKLFNKPIREIDPTIPRRDIDWNLIKSSEKSESIADYSGIIASISSPKTLYQGLVILSIVVLDDKSNKVSLVLSNHYCLLASKLKIGDYIIASKVDILCSVHPEIRIPQMILNEESLLEINPDFHSDSTNSDAISSIELHALKNDNEDNFIHGRYQEGIWSQNLNGEVDLSKLNEYMGVSYGYDDNGRSLIAYTDDIHANYSNRSAQIRRYYRNLSAQ